jgi:hypothetical protein
MEFSCSLFANQIILSKEGKNHVNHYAIRKSNGPSPDAAPRRSVSYSYFRSGLSIVFEIIGNPPRPASKEGGSFFLYKEYSVKKEMKPEGTIKDALSSVLAAPVGTLRLRSGCEVLDLSLSGGH